MTDGDGSTGRWHTVGFLLRHRLLAFTRRVSSRYRMLTYAAFSLGIVYGVLMLWGLAGAMGRIALHAGEVRGPVAFLNQHLLSLSAGLLIFRFLTQRAEKLQVRRYLHLPISRWLVVQTVQATSHLTFHNLLPPVFLIPFWYRYLYLPGGPDTWPWLASAILMLGISHHLTLVLRLVLAISRNVTVTMLAVIVVLIGLDLTAGSDIIQQVSGAIFGRAAAGDRLVIVGFALILAALYGTSTRMLHRALLEPERSFGAGRSPRTTVAFSRRLGPVGNLVLLEMKLIWRHRRPRFYFLFSVLISTLYVAALLSAPERSHGTVLGALAALFATGAFSFNYGQLMFSWDSQFFDGLMTRVSNPQHIVQAKSLLLVLSCLMLYVLTLPLFLLLAPEYLALHVAFTIYNAGVNTIFMLALALRNRDRLDLSRGNNLFNYQGFTAAHWVWFVFTTVPPVLTAYFLMDRPRLTFAIVAGLGLTTLMLEQLWTVHFGRVLVAAQYEMSSGFRQHEH